MAYDTALDHAVTGGFGYFRITTDYADDDAFEQDIKIERIANPLTVYGDETSTAADSSDWNKAFITELYDEEVFQNRWKDAIRPIGRRPTRTCQRAGEKVRWCAWPNTGHGRKCRLSC